MSRTGLATVAGALAFGVMTIAAVAQTVPMPAAAPKRENTRSPAPCSRDRRRERRTVLCARIAAGRI